MTKAARAADKAGKLINTHPAAVFAIAAFLIIALRTACGIVPALIAASLFTAAVLFLCYRGNVRRIVAGVMIFAVILGLLCASHAVVKNTRIVQELNYKTVRAVGTVCTVPTESTVGKRFYFDAKRIYYDGGQLKNVKLYITCGENTDVSLGDELQMNVKLFEPSFGDFDMTQTINAKGAALMGGNVEIVEKGKARFPAGIIYSVRNYLLFVADKFFTGERRALFRALTAGDKSLFSGALTENLRRAGISHIVSISGLHVSTLGFAIYEMLRRMNKKAALAASVLGVFFFAAASGSSPSAMRAAIMFALYMAANALTREGDSFTALTIAALILAMANPYVIFDMGFILSFLSVLSILTFSSKIRMAAFLPKQAGDAAMTTISAQILTLPVMIFAFGEISVYSLPANIVIGLIFPFALTMCFVMCAVAFIPFVSAVAAGICAFCADVIVAVAGMFASLPLSGAQMQGFGIAALLCYGALVTAIFFVRKLRVVHVGGVMCFCAMVMLIGAMV